MTKLTIIVVPTERCQSHCAYCFEGEEVHQGVGMKYSFENIEKGLREVWAGPYHGSDVTLHGGECLMMPLAEIDRLLGLMYNLPLDGGKVRGASSIMTNGSLITDAHIKLFKKWNTYVGISVDGPPELNIYRGPDPLTPITTADYNTKLNETIKKLRDNNIPVSIIAVLHRANAGSVEKLQKLGTWLLKLKKMGITGGRLNPVCWPEHPELELTQSELHRVWLNAYNWNKQYGLKWNPVTEMENNLKTGKGSPCVFAQCDPFNTKTISVLPDGSIGNCDRTFGNGLYPRSDMPGSCGRYEALQQTECAGCEYWGICSGGCPCDAVDSDWRHKTRWCEATKKTYDYIKKKAEIQERPYTGTEASLLKPIGGFKNSPHGDSSHGDSNHGDSQHFDSSHGDTPHGDSSHGDLPDYKTNTRRK